MDSGLAFPALALLNVDAIFFGRILGTTAMTRIIRILTIIYATTAICSCQESPLYKGGFSYIPENSIHIYISSDFQQEDFKIMWEHISAFSRENNINIIADEDDIATHKFKINVERGGGDAFSYSTIGKKIKSHDDSFGKYGICHTRMNSDEDHTLSTVIVSNVGNMTEDMQSFIRACIVPSLPYAQSQLELLRY